MNNKNNTPRYQMTRDEIDKIFKIDAKNGKIYWKHLDHHSKKAGPLGSNDNGYRKVQVNWSDKSKRKRLKCHNVIYNYVNGRIPEGMCIHHKNHDKSDNRIENLDCVTYAENQWRNERKKEII